MNKPAYDPHIHTDNPPETLNERVVKLQRASKPGFYKINRKYYQRIPYGSEDSSWAEKSCHDCGVIKGQLHIPGCDVEQCPACGLQAIGCACKYAAEKSP